mgnify:FL=1
MPYQQENWYSASVKRWMPLTTGLQQALYGMDIPRYFRVKDSDKPIYDAQLMDDGHIRDIKGKDFSVCGQSNLVISHHDGINSGAIAYFEITEQQQEGTLHVDHMAGIDGASPWISRLKGWESRGLSLLAEAGNRSGFAELRIANPYELLGVIDGGFKLEKALRRYRKLPLEMGFDLDETTGECFMNLGKIAQQT